MLESVAQEILKWDITTSGVSPHSHFLALDVEVEFLDALALVGQLGNGNMDLVVQDVAVLDHLDVVPFPGHVQTPGALSKVFEK